METLATPAPLVNALREDGSLDAADALHFPDELAVALYEQMVLLRVFQEKIAALQPAGDMVPRRGVCGEEATALGAVSAMCDEDWIFPGGRELAAALWRGVPLDACAHHALGTTSEEVPPGRAESLPASSPWKKARVVRASPLPATQVPHAVGVAWAARLRKSEMAVVVLFGEAATATADFHSGLNFAGVTGAPVVAVCCAGGSEDGSSGPATAIRRHTASAGLAVKAVAYGLLGVRVNGTDVVAVRNVVREARERAVAGRGGTLIEAVIAPTGGADPLARMRQHLRARGLWGDEHQERVAVEMGADVDRVVAEASATGRPRRVTLFDDVYADLPWHLREQRDSMVARTSRGAAR